MLSLNINKQVAHLLEQLLSRRQTIAILEVLHVSLTWPFQIAPAILFFHLELPDPFRCQLYRQRPQL
jgi:hypothetical protein